MKIVDNESKINHKKTLPQLSFSQLSLSQSKLFNNHSHNDHSQHKRLIDVRVGSQLPQSPAA